jgi:biotin transport system substrate-specific component
MRSQALVSQVLVNIGQTKLNNLISFFFGVLLLSLLSQIIIPLPWTPVPITGQTFGVTLIALLWGQKRAFAIVASYLILGILSFPVFAIAGTATYGYLLGMLMSSALIGYFSDLGWCRSFYKAWFASFLGSCLVLGFGVLWLSFFIPANQLLALGVLPFLPGDLVKTILAVGIATSLTKLK